MELICRLFHWHRSKRPPLQSCRSPRCELPTHDRHRFSHARQPGNLPPLVINASTRRPFVLVTGLLRRRPRHGAGRPRGHGLRRGRQRAAAIARRPDALDRGQSRRIPLCHWRLASTPAPTASIRTTWCGASRELRLRADITVRLLSSIATARPCCGATPNRAGHILLAPDRPVKDGIGEERKQLGWCARSGPRRDRHLGAVAARFQAAPGRPLRARPQPSTRGSR